MGKKHLHGQPCMVPTFKIVDKKIPGDLQRLYKNILERGYVVDDYEFDQYDDMRAVAAKLADKDQKNHKHPLKNSS